jgi:hypothetical protein
MRSSRDRPGRAEFAASIALALLLLDAGSALGQMYKCTDERGVTQYSDKPRPGCRGGEVDIQPIPPVWGKVIPYKEDLKAAEQAFQRRQMQRDREFTSERRRLADAMRRCEILNAELQSAAARRRVPDSVAHDARIARLNAEILQKCR